MGMFDVTVKLANPGDSSRSSDVSLLVETDATLSWIPRELLPRLSVRPTTRLEFQFADGRTTLREVGAALFTVDGKTLNNLVRIWGTWRRKCAWRDRSGGPRFGR